MIGDDRDEIIGQPCTRFIRSAEKDRCPIDDLCQDGDRREDVLICSSGREIPVLKRAKQVELDGHSLILESIVDISELKEAEESVRRSETKFRALFESSRDAVMILDRNGFTNCNTATLEMFGCSRAEEFLGRNITDFSPPVQPSGRGSEAEAERLMEEALSTGSCFFEWVYRRQDGTEFPAEVMLSAVETEAGRMLQAMVRDVTRRKALEDELMRLAATDSLTGGRQSQKFSGKGRPGAVAFPPLQSSLRFSHDGRGQFQGCQRHVRPCRRR